MFYSVGLTLLLAAASVHAQGDAGNTVTMDPATCLNEAKVAAETDCIWSPATCATCTATCVQAPMALRNATAEGMHLLLVAEEALQVCLAAGSNVSDGEQLLALAAGKSLPDEFVTCPPAGKVDAAYKADDTAYPVDEPSLLGSADKRAGWELDLPAFKAYVATNCSDHTLTADDVKAYGALDLLDTDVVESGDAGSKVCSSRILGPESLPKLAAAVKLCRSQLADATAEEAQCAQKVLRTPSEGCWTALLPHVGRTKMEIDTFIEDIKAAETSCGAAKTKVACEAVETTTEAAVAVATKMEVLTPSSAVGTFGGFTALAFAGIITYMSL